MKNLLVAAMAAVFSLVTSVALAETDQVPVRKLAGFFGQVQVPEDWKPYVLDQFGTTVSYPADIFKAQSKDKDGWPVFQAGKDAQFRLSGMVNADHQSIDARIKKAVTENPPEVVTGLTRLSDKAFRLDGLFKGFRFLRIETLGTNDAIHSFVAVYTDKSAGLVGTIAGTLRETVPQADEPAETASASTGDSAVELAFWGAIKDSTDSADFKAYLDQFPHGVFAALAQNRLKRFSEEQAATAPAPKQPHDWQTYVNDRYGTRIDYPADLFTPLPPPDSNDGRRFEMADGRGGFYVFSQYNALEQSLSELYDQDRKRAGEKILYANLGSDSFVISGNRGSDIFFRKLVLFSDGLISVFELHVRSDAPGLFNDISARMATTFDTIAPDSGDAAPAKEPNGTYSSQWGDMVFATQPDGAVRSDYEDGQSHIEGRLDGTTLTGRWIEPMSNQRCSDGKYWGRLEVEFAPDFGSFKGRWSYCDMTPDRDVQGERIGAAAAPPAEATPAENTSSETPPPPAPVASFGPFTTPARGSAERAAIMDAARGPVAKGIGQTVLFVVDILRADDHWAYLQATPVQKSGAALDWNKTNFAADWQADAMSDTVMVLLNKDGGNWQEVDHVVGPTDVYWYSWVERFGLPESLFAD